jgi:hypothetical protein
MNVGNIQASEANVVDGINGDGFWLSGPRLFNNLIRHGISFSGREFSSKVSEDATLGICRRADGAMMLAIPGTKSEAEFLAKAGVQVNKFKSKDFRRYALNECNPLDRMPFWGRRQLTAG